MTLPLEVSIREELSLQRTGKREVKVAAIMNVIRVGGTARRACSRERGGLFSKKKKKKKQYASQCVRPAALSDCWPRRRWCRSLFCRLPWPPQHIEEVRGKAGSDQDRHFVNALAAMPLAPAKAAAPVVGGATFGLAQVIKGARRRPSSSGASLALSLQRARADPWPRSPPRLRAGRLRLSGRTYPASTPLQANQTKAKETPPPATPGIARKCRATGGASTIMADLCSMSRTL